MVHRAFVVSGLILLAGCPDKNSPERQARMAVEKMTQYANMMCACKDKDCADKVQEELTKWATEMARENSKSRDQRPDEETMKKMTDVATKYGECMTKAMMPVTPPRDDIPPPNAVRDADQLLRDARAWAREKQPNHLAVDTRVYYVEANGTLDGQHGRLEIVFGRSLRKVDDPKRKIGAPLPPRVEPDDCFQLTWTPVEGWSRTTYGCPEAFDLSAHCTVKQVWQRAIARKAPPEALASVTWRASASEGSWELRIQDEPREINIVESFADDCPLSVEK